MADQQRGNGRKPARSNPALAAALIGGAAAATAGAVWSARALARRNGARHAHDLSPVMQTAVTACELAHGRGAGNGRASAAPRPGSAPTGWRRPAG